MCWRACRSSPTSGSKVRCARRRRQKIRAPATMGQAVKATSEKNGERVEAPSSLTAVHPILPWIVACALLLPLPICLSNAYTQFVVNVICINIILAVGLNIVKGFAGQVTVGHIALAAIGAYASAVLATKAGLPFWAALPAAMLVTAGAGAIVGIPSFRLEGAYLALATLGLAESVRIVISGTEWLGAAVGYEGIPPPFLGSIALSDHRSYYYVA